MWTVSGRLKEKRREIRMLAHERVRDRAPEIRAAGKLVPRGHGAKECLKINTTNAPQTPVLVKQFRGMTRPEPGQPRVHHSSSPVEPSNKEVAQGVKTKSSLEAADLVNPPLKTGFQQALLHQQDSLYASKQKAPLGSSHDQSHGLPKGMDPMLTRFGLATLKDESAGAIVNPDKSSEEVGQEHEEGRELYKKSHNGWGVGEMMDRDYDWSTFTKHSLYGVPSPHDNSGGQVRDALHWLHLAQSGKKSQLVSKRVDNFRERTQPQLGKVHDPIAETLDVPDNYTFGVMVKPDDYNAGELMHMEGPSSYQQCVSVDSGVLASVRHHLKKYHFHNFDELLDALQHHDNDGTGHIPSEVVHETCFQFNMPITHDMLDMVIRWCSDGTPQGGVAYKSLVQLLDWKKQPDEKVLQSIAQRQQQTQDAPPPGAPSAPPPSSTSPSKLMSNYLTSSQTIKAVVGGVPTGSYQVYGVPTIRSDLPAPRIKRVGDHTNYGDESDAYGLMYPSIYSNSGVYEEDFFKPRPPQVIRHIFESIGVSMTPEVFHELWREAVRRDPKGEVSVESFRAIMEEVQAARQHLKESAQPPPPPQTEQTHTAQTVGTTAA